MRCEAEIDRATDAAQALRTAERALRELETMRAGLGQGAEAPGRLLRMIETWQRRRAALARDVEAAQAERSIRSATRRLAAAAALLVGVLAVVMFSLRGASDAHAGAHPLEAQALLQPEPLRQAATDLARALQRVEAQDGDRIALAETVVRERASARAELQEFALQAFDVTAGRAIAEASAADRPAVEAAAAAARERIRQFVRAR